MMDATEKLRVLIAGGGVAALEGALALRDLAPDRTAVTVLAPNSEFFYRPMAVREPFAYGPAERYKLAPIVRDAGAELLSGELASVDAAKQTIQTKAGEWLDYGALLVAVGGRTEPSYEHALTIDDRHLDETLEGLIQDVEGGYVRSIAFVSPGRMPWQLPLYELALMTAGRAYDMDEKLAVTILTPEDRPLAIFGEAASEAVRGVLEKAGIETINSAYCEIPHRGEVLVNPGDRRLQVDRVVALPELYGPSVDGLPLAENGFIRVDRFEQVPGAGPVFAAGDASDFPVKHGGLAAQQADTAAGSIAALAGAEVTQEPFKPVIHGMLLTADKPLYLSAQITGGQGSSSEVSDKPTWSPPAKIYAKYLAQYLAEHPAETAPQR
jgi:sulfide:quinone oxidoreductase